MTLLNNALMDDLESEAVYVIRETAAQFERPCLLFSGGKDSIVLTHLASAAFRPGRLPFPLVHIDTGHNFPETIAFRDDLVRRTGATLIVGQVQDSIDAGRVAEQTGPDANRNRLQSVTLLDALNENGFDAALGGGRRDEEKARAKERFFSHRDASGSWDPKNQRPEMWSLFNGRKKAGEHFRVFPLSNWTELDVWHYISRKKIEVPSLYFSHQREVIERNGTLLPVSPWLMLKPNEVPQRRHVRFRTCGDMPITGALESEAASVEDIIRELRQLRSGERGTRNDDKFSESSMEDRKRQGYF